MQQNVWFSFTFPGTGIKYEQTKSQSKSQKWYELTAGRITASVMKEACKTYLDEPSLSLIKKN